jgi:hypothetical protein
LPIFASYGSCAYKNSSAKFKQNILTFPFEIIVWPQKTAKMVSFGNIWSVFHLTTHEKWKTDQNYTKKTYKTLHNTTFFPGMTSVLQKISPDQSKTFLICWPPISMFPQAPVSFKKYRPPPLPYFKVNICPFPLPHFASIFFAYLWSFRWPNDIVTLPRYFSLRLPHLNIPTELPSDELNMNISERSLFYF